MKKIAELISTGMIAVGVIYWLGLIGLIVVTEPSGGGGGSGASRFDGGSFNIPGARWFIHAGIACSILIVAALIKPKNQAQDQRPQK